MYQKHFGLKTKPFGSNAEGPAVFVGPQQTNVINSLKKGLNSVDSIVTVSGPVGVGKTTLVSRALEAVSPGRMVAWVGRMSLAPDEVLELLLTGFGISRQATGTIQRYAAFRRLLGERATAGAQVAIAVEDAQRVGVDALVELESLTAADSGDATGANIILMGQPELNEWLATPALARLRQRMRLRQSIEPFNPSEVLGYLRHSIRNAGGDFDRIFDAGAVDMLHRCSEGIPRVINNLCESALATAADEGTGPLTAKFIQKVARDMLGIEVYLPHSPATSIVAALAAPEPTPAPAPESTPAPAPTMPEPAVSAEPDIESTQPQKKPEWKLDQPGVVEDNNDEEIPRELTFEVEQTARMQAINADKIVQAEKEGKLTAEDPAPTFKAAPLITVDKDTRVGGEPAAPPQAETEPEPVTGPSDDDLPMLSQSMRITAPTPAPPEAMPKPKPVAPIPAPIPAPKLKPPAAAKPAPKPKAPVEAKAAPKPKPKAPVEAKAAPKPKPKAPVEAKAAPKPKPKAPVEAKAAPKPKPKAPVAAKAAPKPKPKAPEAAKAAPKPTPKAQPTPKATPAPKPTPKPAPAAKPKAPEAAKAKPKAKADPNAETGEKPRMPDIDTLEAAIEAAHKEAAVEVGPEPADDKRPAVGDVTLSDIPALSVELEATLNGPAAEPAPAPKPAPAPAPTPGGDKGPDDNDATLAGVPALTLDKTLDERRAEVAALDPKVAEKMGEAESIKDLTDTMAETLFGDAEFEAIAADVVANPPPGKTAPGKAAKDASPVMLEPEQQPEPDKAGKPAAPAAKPKETGQTNNLELSMSRRMDMVKELNKANAKPKKEELAEAKPEAPAPAPAPAPKPSKSQPESIENQMDTAMTGMMQALSDVDIPQDDDSEDNKSGGLFSRFKRSS